MNRISVQPDWCLDLPLQQQSVLLLAARGPDGIPKTNPCKRVQVAYRGTVLVAARYGRCLHWGEQADGFMSLHEFSDAYRWQEVVSAFFLHIDELPHHFLMHLLHGVEILGYQHPDDSFRGRWFCFYLAMVDNLHLVPETKEQMDRRLSDWNRAEWE